MNHFDYDGWKTGWYEASRESDPDAEREVETIEIPVQQLNDFKASFLQVLKCVYGKEKLNVANLEEHLACMAYELNIELPVEEIKLERKVKQSDLFMFVADLSRKSATL